MRILVTGAGGYIGAPLCTALLSAGHEVYAVDTTEKGLLGTWTDRLTADDPKVIDLSEDVDVVIPLAAVVGAKACAEDPKRAAKTNRDAVVKLAHRDTRIVYLTTDSGYHDPRPTEMHAFAPTSAYAVSKYEAEMTLLDSRAPVVSFRLGSVFGVSPRMRDDLLTHFLAKASVGEAKCAVSGANVTRSFVSLNDVVRAVLFAVDGKLPRGIYNLALPEGVRKGKICEHLQMLTGYTGFHEDESAYVDPDQRSFEMDVSKILDAGFSFSEPLPGVLPLLVEHYDHRATPAHRRCYD